MANKADNIYLELFEQLPIPKRLEPENIAMMLSEATKSEPAASSEKITKSKPVATETAAEASQETRNITKTSNRRKTSTAFRSIASIAACAALAFGVAGYMGVFDDKLPSEIKQGGAQFAENYDDLHKTFEEYYVGDEDKKTLDSAIADIEHSYNDNQNETHSAPVKPDPEPEKPETPAPLVTEAPAVTQPDNVPDNITTEPAAPIEENPEVEEIPPVEEIPEEEEINQPLPIPEQKAKTVDGEVQFGTGYMVEQKAGALRIFSTDGGKVEFTDTVAAMPVIGVEKTLVGFYADGLKLTAVYSSAVMPGYPQDPAVGGLLDGLYGAQPSASGYSVEVCVYNVLGGKASLETDFVQDGSLIDMNYQNGSLYLVTAYNDYRNAPIVGVDDLQSYVPGYSVNGSRVYIEPQNIMIPDYLSTTDYTVISGVSVNGGVSVQAVLGYEGRVILQNGAVYLFGYNSTALGDVTTAKVFSLANGQVTYAGYKDLGGVALGGDGISLFGNYIAVTSVAEAPTGYVTTLVIYDGTMNMKARAQFIGVALTNVTRKGDRLYFSGAGESHVIDLTNPEKPYEVLDAGPEVDPADGLVEFDGGYVTLTKDAQGGLILSKLSKGPDGSLMLDYSTTLCDAEGRSKALENNGILFVNGSTVGVPYGFFDGLDYTFRYGLFRAGPTGFEPIGEIEAHETDETFETGKAFLNDGYLYIFSEGRVYCASTQDGLSVTGTANLVQSAYSGHGM